MAVNNISLLAEQSYLQVQNRPKLDIKEPSLGEGISFEKVLKQEFNSYAKMSPSEILNHIKKVQIANETKSSIQDDAVIYSGIKAIKNSATAQETVSAKLMAGQASSIELLTAVTEAKNTIDLMVKIRDKVIDTLDKLINISI